MSALSVEGAADAHRVCLGAIAGAQGVRGAVRIKSFTAAPQDVAAYGPLEDEPGERRFDIAVEGVARDLVVARISGIDDRSAAEALRGTRLYVDRARLPPTADGDEFYHADLLGLEAVDPAGAAIGRVSGIIPAGGADVLEIACTGRAQPLLVPFTCDAVPTVEIAAGRIVVVPPDREDEDEDEDAGDDRAT